ncbi:hypothetical protein JKG47_17585 [Acidithiobacillus sp. MC6.1]|nr:hypothetical protein [Acidithiobacillus sp. MC6.1]
MSLPSKSAYWRSLLRHDDRLSHPHLLPGHADELRAALRDALHELEALQQKKEPGLLKRILRSC